MIDTSKNRRTRHVHLRSCCNLYNIKILLMAFLILGSITEGVEYSLNALQSQFFLLVLYLTKLVISCFVYYQIQSEIYKDLHYSASTVMHIVNFFGFLILVDLAGGLCFQLAFVQSPNSKFVPRTIILLCKFFFSLFFCTINCFQRFTIEETIDESPSLSMTSVMSEDVISFVPGASHMEQTFSLDFLVKNSRNDVLSKSRRTLEEFNGLFQHVFEKFGSLSEQASTFKVTDENLIDSIVSKMNRILQNRDFYDFYILKFLGINSQKVISKLLASNSRSMDTYIQICREVPSLFSNIAWSQREEAYPFYFVKIRQEQEQISIDFENKIEKTKHSLFKSMNEFVLFMYGLGYFIGNWDDLSPTNLLIFFEEKLNMMLNERTYSHAVFGKFFDFYPKMLPIIQPIKVVLQRPKDTAKLTNWNKVEIRYLIETNKFSIEKSVSRSKEQILMFFELCKLKKSNMKVNSFVDTHIFLETVLSFVNIVDMLQKELNVITVADSTEARMFLEIGNEHINSV